MYWSLNPGDQLFEGPGPDIPGYGPQPHGHRDRQNEGLQDLSLLVWGNLRRRDLHPKNLREIGDVLGRAELQRFGRRTRGEALQARSGSLQNLRPESFIEEGGLELPLGLFKRLRRRDRRDLRILLGLRDLRCRDRRGSGVTNEHCNKEERKTFFT